MTLSIDPRFLDSLLVTWTGLVIVALMLLGGAFLVSRAGSLGITRGEAYRLYVISLLWGLVGARLLHVVDYAAFYWDSPLQVFYIWNGGFSAWGALLGTIGGGLLHARRQSITLMPMAEPAVVGGLTGLAVFRLAEFLTGGRAGAGTDLPWGVVYAHPASPAYLPTAAQHPVAGYEFFLVLGVLGIMWLRRRAKAGRGVVARGQFGILDFPDSWLAPFALAAYGGIRFVVGFARVDPAYLWLDMSQWIGLLVIAGAGIVFATATAGPSPRLRAHANATASASLRSYDCRCAIAAGQHFV